MYQLSETMQTAMAAGNPQRILLEFTDPDTGTVTTMSNEEVSVTAGVSVYAPFNAEEELTFGLCPSAEVQFTLLNDERQLADFRFGECAVWLGVRIDEGTPDASAKTATFREGGRNALYEFAPIGVYIVERPDVVQKDSIQIRANDRMSKFDEEMPSQSDLGFSPMPSDGVSILQLLQALCTQAGVTLATTTFLNSDLTFTTWPKKYFDGRTMREVLKWIAEAAGSIARFNRQGELELVWFSDVNVSYTEGDYSEFTRAWYETAAVDGLKVRNQSETSESTVGTGTDNNYVISGNPFLS